MNIIEEVLISNLNRDRPTRYIFRGQADWKWKLESSATRRIAEQFYSRSEWEQLGTPERMRTFSEYNNKVILQDAQRLGFDISAGNKLTDLQLLAMLQHFGAATGFMDFTKSPLIALWFAASDLSEVDGAIFAADLNEFEKFHFIDDGGVDFSDISSLNCDDSRIFCWEPIVRSEAWARILRQRSILILDKPWINEDDWCTKIKIDTALKEELRNFLDILDHNEGSIFTDVYGFCNMNSSSSSLRNLRQHLHSPQEYLSQGKRFYQKDDYDSAISYFTRCIDVAGDVREPYFLRGCAHAQKRNYQQAIEDYNKGESCTKAYLFLLQLNVHLVKDMDLWTLKFNRANSYAAIGNYEDALNDYNGAIEAHVGNYALDAVYYNRANAKANMGQYGEAINDYDVAIQYFDNDVRISHALFNKANCILRSGDMYAAKKYYNQCNSIDPNLTEKNLVTCEKMIQHAESRKGHVRIVEVSYSSSPYSFNGNTGNVGDFGSGVRGGSGYRGGAPFNMDIIA